MLPQIRGPRRSSPEMASSMTARAERVGALFSTSSRSIDPARRPGVGCP